MLRWLKSTAHGEQLSNARSYSGAFRRKRPSLRLDAPSTRPSQQKDKSVPIESLLRQLLLTETLRNPLEGLVAPEKPTADNPTLSVTSGVCIVYKKPSAGMEAILCIRDVLSAKADISVSAYALKHMYDTVISSPQRTQLSSVEFSALISLFGTLSVEQSSTFTSNFVNRVSRDSPGQYWSFVMNIAEDKRKFCRGLNTSDRYWLMRAHLAAVEKDKSRATYRAYMQYATIWQSTGDPEVHMPFFKALLSLQTPKSLVIAVQNLCNVLIKFEKVHGGLVNLLWDIVLSETNTALKEMLVSMIWKRLIKFPLANARGRRSSRRQLDAVLGKYVRNPLGVTDLSLALTAPVFPLFRTSIPLSLQRWAAQEARSAFSPNQPLQIRWRNLVLLALSHRPELLTSGLVDEVRSQQTDWKTIFTLTILVKRIEDLLQLSSPVHTAAVVRSLWERWIATNQEPRSLLIARIVASAFFQLNVVAMDPEVTTQCFQYSGTHRLLHRWENATALDEAQRRGLLVDYALAFVRSHGLPWRAFLHTLSDMSPEWRGEAMGTLVTYFIKTDPVIARDVYRTCSDSKVSLPVSVIHAMCIVVAKADGLTVVPFLLQPHFSPKQREQLLGHVLQFIHTQRLQVLDPKSAATIAQTLLRLYKWQLPAKPFLKYPIRYLLPLLAASKQADAAVTVIGSMWSRQRSFFTARYIRRTLRQLLRHREYQEALRLAEMARHLPSEDVDRLRRTLVFSLTKAGARRLAARAYHRIRPLSRSLPERNRADLREYLASKLGFSRFPPSRKASKTVARLELRYTDIPSVKYAFSVLLNARRTVQARKLFQNALPHLDGKSKTWMGNAYLQKSFSNQRSRSGDRVRKVLQARAYLIRKFQFVDDRVTFNIVLKALLTWNRGFDSYTVKVLFDHCARQGYFVSVPPAVSPFETSRAPRLSEPTGLPSNLSESIRFEKHAQSLLKMFIRAFYARGDRDAAHVVVSILKNEQVLAMERRQVAGKRRMLGIRAKRLSTVHRKKL